MWLFVANTLRYDMRDFANQQNEQIMVYSLLSNLFPTRQLQNPPKRIVFIRPCCIGDVVMATAALSALRELYPEAHITWAVGTWSAQAVTHHPAIDAILDTGDTDLPVRSVGGVWQFVCQLRAGQYDLAVSLVRSPLMSLAVLLSGIPYRAGLDSLGRGFGYNIRVPIDPARSEHESLIYLKVISALAGRPIHAYANILVLESARESLHNKLSTDELTTPYIVVHPGGGSNPGMQMDSKRYPIDQLARIVNPIASEMSAKVIVIGGANDKERVVGLMDLLDHDAVGLFGSLTFTEIGALAEAGLLYIGNDTGLTHLASASGAKTVMMMGPTDPKRYAPFTDNHLVLWKPTDLQTGGVASADTSTWDWSRDGFTVDYAIEKIRDFIR